MWQKNQTRNQVDQYSAYKGSTVQKIDDTSSQGSFAGRSYSRSILARAKGSISGSVRSGRSGRSGTSRNPHDRVQVISDFESSDESIADINLNELE